MNMNSDLTLVPLEKSGFLMGFITPKQTLRVATGQANEKKCKITMADALKVSVDELLK